MQLADGPNAVTLHATGLNGNTATTQASFTLDYSNKTNPPALNILWPQNGSAVSGTNLTLQAQVDDDTATVTVQIADPDGDTSTLQGLVERSGLVLVNNLPLSPGTNTLTLTAVNAAGNSMMTNLTLVQSSAIVTVDPFTQPDQANVTVTGTISDPTASLTVNGTNAVTDGEGDWEADNVPVSPTGTAMFDIEIYGADSAWEGSLQIAQPQPPVIAMTAYEMKSYGSATYYNWCRSGTPSGSSSEAIDWTLQSGGTDNNYASGINGDCEPQDQNTSDTIPSGYNGYSPDWEISSTTGPSDILPYWASVNSHWYYNNNYMIGIQSRTANTQPSIMPSDQAPVGPKTLYLVSVQVFDEDSGNQLPGSSLQFQNQLPGTTAVDMTNGAGAIWSQFLATGPAGTNFSVTPIAAGRNISFNTWYVTNITLQIVDNNTSNVLSGSADSVIVGQQMNLSCQLNVTNALLMNSMLSNFQWTVPGDAISNYVVAADTSSAYVATNFPTTNSIAQFYWVDGAYGRVVQCSALLNGATITGQAVFNIVMPTARILTPTSAVALGIPQGGGFFGICFGTNGGAPGILFVPIISMPQGNYNYGNTAYTPQWVQVIDASSIGSRTFQQGTNIVIVSQLNTNVVLDTKYPYGFSSGLPYPDTADSPAIATDGANEIAASATQYSQMWLMFQPTNGGWVPLRTVSWYFSGSATNSGTNWTLFPPAWSTNPPDSNAAGAFPIWDGNITNVPTTVN